MKKMSKHKGRISIEGASDADGMHFFAKIYEEDTITDFLTGTQAIIDEAGTITCKDCLRGHVERKHDKILIKMMKKLSRYIVVSFLFIMIMLTITLFTNQMLIYEMLLAVSMFIIAINSMKTAVAMFVLRIIGDEEVCSMARFHSAEHAVDNAYYDLNRVPTIEEIKNYSNYSYNCGSLREFQKAIFLLMFSIVLALKIWIPGILFSIIGFCIAIIISIILNATGRICFLEFMVLGKPTEKEYTVAIQALESLLNKISSYENEDLDSSLVVEVMIETYEE